MASKVLLISARSDIGGGPAHMFALARGMAHEISICAAMPEDGEFFKSFVDLVGAKNLCKIPRQKFTLRAFIELRAFCKAQQIDLIHSHGKGAGVYSRLLGWTLGLPVVHTLHGYHDGRYSLGFKKIYAFWETFAGWLTRKIICVSISEAELFKNKVIVADSKLAVIINGTAVQAHLIATKPTPKKVVTVARFDYQKNLLELLRLAELLPLYDFFVIGDGADRSEIQSEIAARNLHNVRLCGVSHKVLEDIADASVFVTTARWEGLPLAVLEAMSLGIPVVASDVVGNRDAVEEGVTGYLYPLGDVKVAARLVEDAARLDRELVRQYHRQYFSSERMVEETLAVYRDVLNGSR
jgi:glycosyltransferase involved in cell wall biosynthesis